MLSAAVAACFLVVVSAAAHAATPTRAEGEALMTQALDAQQAGDDAGARRLMEQSAASGYPEAMNGLAVLLERGIGGPADPERAKALMEAAAAAGSPAAKLNLGRELLDSDSRADRSRGFDLVQDAAADPRLAKHAALELGKAYIFGLGVKKDLRRGVDLLESAGEEAWYHGQIQYLLGRTYQSGWGGRAENPALSFKHFRRAAELDMPRAAWIAGMMLINGDGVARDEREAFRWVRKAAELGDLNGQISTAVMLATGEGVTENDAEARDWYRKAAEGNSAHALRGLGFMLVTGEGGPVEAARGRAYVELAAEGGDENAAHGLEGALEFPAYERADVDRIKAEWIAAHHGAPMGED